MQLLSITDRIQFREKWEDYLRSNPQIAIATGHEKYLEPPNENQQHSPYLSENRNPSGANL